MTYQGILHHLLFVQSPVPIMSQTSLHDSYHLQNLYDLTGLIALVTGGGTGIGLMIAHGLAANGAKVYITGRREDVLQKVADSFGKEDGLIVA